MAVSFAQSSLSPSGSVTSVALCPPSICSFHAFHPDAHSAQLKSAKEEKRAISLQVALDADYFSLIVAKKHRSVVNDVLFPELQEEVEESSWKCFGNNYTVDIVPVKKDPQRKKKNADKHDKKKVPVVKLTVYTQNAVSTRDYEVFPPKTAKKAARLAKDSASISPSTAPVTIDTTVPPPSSHLPVVIDTTVPPPSFLTPPTSGPASPSISVENPPFAFNVGVVNAPRAGVKVAKKHLLDNGDAFEMIVDVSKPKKVKIFSTEEIRKQSSLVDEWKRKIQESL